MIMDLKLKLQRKTWRGGEIQRVTPAMMRDTPITVSSPLIFSPRAAPATAVTAKVVALVTGTARVIGLSPSLITNRTDMERFKRKGREYSHTQSSCIHSCKMLQTKVGRVFLELLALCLDPACAFCFFASAIRAPRFINAFVAPHTVPIPSNQATTAISFLSPYLHNFYHLPVSVLCMLIQKWRLGLLDYMQQAWEYKENFGETNIENLCQEFLPHFQKQQEDSIRMVACMEET